MGCPRESCGGSQRALHHTADGDDVGGRKLRRMRRIISTIIHIASLQSIWLFYSSTYVARTQPSVLIDFFPHAFFHQLSIAIVLQLYRPSDRYDRCGDVSPPIHLFAKVAGIHNTVVIFHNFDYFLEEFQTIKISKEPPRVNFRYSYENISEINGCVFRLFFRPLQAVSQTPERVRDTRAAARRAFHCARRAPSWAPPRRSARRPRGEEVRQVPAWRS